MHAAPRGQGLGGRRLLHSNSRIDDPGPSGEHRHRIAVHLRNRGVIAANAPMRWMISSCAATSAFGAPRNPSRSGKVGSELTISRASGSLIGVTPPLTSRRRSTVVPPAPTATTGSDIDAFVRRLLRSSLPEWPCLDRPNDPHLPRALLRRSDARHGPASRVTGGAS